MPWTGGSGNSGGTVVFRLDYFDATPLQTVFNLPATPVAPTKLIGFVNGVEYRNGTDFSVVGNVFTWLDVDFTLTTGDVVGMYYEV
jgi:hypothetical protein